MSNINATAIFTEKDQDFRNETTTYWFVVQSEDARIESGEYGICDNNGEIFPVYDDGAPIDCNEFERSAILSVCQITEEMIQA